jgi:UDP:flavonoid glycosyltransferase YjiC (YdhE family)
MRRRRILFLAEPATLAHVVRSATLAGGLDRSEFEVVFATGESYRHLVQIEGAPFEPLAAIGTRAFLDRVASGGRLYTPSDVDAYLEEDRRLLQQVQPDAVVGDFRLSLSVSARRARVPYFALCNAYWSRRARVVADVPVHPATRVLGLPLARAAFGAVRPLLFAYHGAPFAARARGSAAKGASTSRDIRDAITDADVRLYADPPEIVPIDAPTRRDVYLGPILWSPDVPMPALAEDDRPLVYVTLGSSGDPRLLPTVVGALAKLPCRIVVATVGAALPSRPPNVEIVELAPGFELAKRARLVVSNGGSSTGYQALAAGAPVLGIPSNMDQLFAMMHLVRAGVAESVRADQASAGAIARTAQAMLAGAHYRERAQAMAGAYARFEPAKALARSLHDVLSGHRANGDEVRRAGRAPFFSEEATA